MKTKVGEGLQFHYDNWIRDKEFSRRGSQMVKGRSSSPSMVLSAFPMLTKMLSGLTSVTPKFRQGSRDRNHLCGLYRTLDTCNQLQEDLTMRLTTFNRNLPSNLKSWSSGKPDRGGCVTNAKCGPCLHWSWKRASVRSLSCWDWYV
jgi:hypothetical protein